MAQWSNRDSRWIVEDLGKNGSNVGSWHWEEKSKMQWSKQRFHELTDGIDAELNPDVGTARLTGLQDLTGEASNQNLTCQAQSSSLVCESLQLLTTSSCRRAGVLDKKERQ